MTWTFICLSCTKIYKNWALKIRYISRSQISANYSKFYSSTTFWIIPCFVSLLSLLWSAFAWNSTRYFQPKHVSFEVALPIYYFVILFPMFYISEQSVPPLPCHPPPKSEAQKVIASPWRVSFFGSIGIYAGCFLLPLPSSPAQYQKWNKPISQREGF